MKITAKLRPGFTWQKEDGDIITGPNTVVLEEELVKANSHLFEALEMKEGRKNEKKETKPEE